MCGDWPIQMLLNCRTAKRTGTVCARVRRVRASMRAPGITASKCRACTYGRRATRMGANGRTGNDTDWAWRRVVVGCTGASGRKDTRAATARASLPTPWHATQARGQVDCRTATARKHMLMEVGVGEGRSVCGSLIKRSNHGRDRLTWRHCAVRPRTHS
jgi:hypothetical protein